MSETCIENDYFIYLTPDNLQVYCHENFDIHDWNFDNLTPFQEKYCRYNRVDYISNPAKKTKRKAPACINAISGKFYRKDAIQEEYAGEKLNIYPGYTEFRPHEPNMNLANKKFKGFKDYSEKSREEINKKHAMHYQYKATRYDTIPATDRISVYKIENEIVKVDVFDPSNEEKKIGADGLTKKQRAAMLSSESRIYIQPPSRRIPERSKRGIISCISKKSANRLKKLMCRVFDLDLWLDLTFSDDVFEGMTFQERLAKAYDCLNKFERLIRKHGLYYIWKKEIKERLSGSLMGHRVCHYHVVLCGLSEKQKRDYHKLSILLLASWVSITGTKNPKALTVALKSKNGTPCSYRLIDNSTTAAKYIGKYFGKTEKLDGHKKISIGRAWGYSKNIPLADPIEVNLNREESILLRRFLRRMKNKNGQYKIQKNEEFIGVREQLERGYSTFLFFDEDLIMRLINKYVEDPFKAPIDAYDPIPF